MPEDHHSTRPSHTDALAARHLPQREPGHISPLPEVPRHPIAYAAKRAGLHPQTLRAYERRELISPARTEGGKRLFSDRDITRAQRIRAITDDHIPLTAARRVLRLEDLLHTAIDRIKTLEDQNRRLSDRLRGLELSR